MHQSTLLRDERVVTVGVTDTVLAGPNARRRSLIIGAPPTSAITIAFSKPAVANQGLILAPNIAPFQLTEGNVGSALHEDIHAISPTAPQQVYIMDVFDT